MGDRFFPTCYKFDAEQKILIFSVSEYVYRNTQVNSIIIKRKSQIIYLSMLKHMNY